MTSNYKIIDGRRMLIRCQYCGATYVKASIYRDMCTDCGKRFKTYEAFCNKNNTDPSPSVTKRLVDIMSEYACLRNKGFMVPQSVPEEAHVD